jgi:hypothetical protein
MVWDGLLTRILLGFEHIQLSSILPSNLVTPVWLGVEEIYVRCDPHRW